MGNSITVKNKLGTWNPLAVGLSCNKPLVISEEYKARRQQAWDDFFIKFSSKEDTSEDSALDDITAKYSEAHVDLFSEAEEDHSETESDANEGCLSNCTKIFILQENEANRNHFEEDILSLTYNDIIIQSNEEMLAEKENYQNTLKGNQCYQKNTLTNFGKQKETMRKRKKTKRKQKMMEINICPLDCAKKSKFCVAQGNKIKQNKEMLTKKETHNFDVVTSQGPYDSTICTAAEKDVLEMDVEDKDYYL